MSLGLKRGIVQLEPHDKQWDEIALQTIKTLKSILGDDAIDIQHIGSTAIPAIKSKPIIDIAVGVTDFYRNLSASCTTIFCKTESCCFIVIGSGGICRNQSVCK